MSELRKLDAVSGTMVARRLNGVAGEAVGKVSRNGGLPRGWDWILSWPVKVSRLRAWRCHGVAACRHLYWEPLSCSGVRPGEVDAVSVVPVWHRLFRGTKLLSQSQGRRMAVGRPRRLRPCRGSASGVCHGTNSQT